MLRPSYIAATLLLLLSIAFSARAAAAPAPASQPASAPASRPSSQAAQPDEPGAALPRRAPTPRRAPPRWRKPRRAVDAETPPGARAAPAVRAAARTGSSVGSARGARLVHRLVLRAGTLTAGGSVALDYNTTVGDASSDSNFHVSISPSFGVFVANGLEVGLDLRFDISTVDTRVNTYTIRGLLRMYLGSWLVAPYIGVAFGPQLFDVRVTLLGGVTDTLQSRFELAPEFGVAVPLRRWVALTFALSPQILFPLSDQLEGVVVALNVSLLGVRAFF